MPAITVTQATINSKGDSITAHNSRKELVVLVDFVFPWGIE
jgi:hypothetical protein